jgi:hypothetical protein
MALTRTVLACGLLGAALGGVLVLGAGWAPYDVLRAWLDRFAGDGSADAYTPAAHAAIVGRVRIAGGVLLGLGAVVAAGSGRVAAFLARLGRSALVAGADLRGALRRFRRETPPAQHVVFALILLVGVAVRLRWLDGPMRYDESFTFLNYVRYPLALGLTRYDAPNNHLFHTFLAHLSFRLFGDEPWALRLPAFLAGVSVLPLTYALGRTLAGASAGLFAMAIVATSLPVVLRSVDARGYTIMTVAFLLLLLVADYVRRTNSLAGWAAMAGLAALGAWTIPTMLYAYATVVAWLGLALLTGQLPASPGAFLRRLAGGALATGLLTALLYAPILVRTDLGTLLASPTVATKVTRRPWPKFLEGNVIKAVDTWHRWMDDQPVAVRAALVIGLAAALVAPGGSRRTRVALAVAPVVGCVPLLLLQRVIPFSRVWAFLQPMYVALAAAGLVWLTQRVPRLGPAAGLRLVQGGAVALAVWLGATAATRASAYDYGAPEFPGAGPIVQFLKPALGRGDTVIVVDSAQVPFYYYCHLYGLPERYVFDYVLRGWDALDRRRRLYVVVNERRQAQPWVLAQARLDDGRPPRLVFRAEQASVYVLEPDPSRAPSGRPGASTGAGRPRRRAVAGEAA